MRIVLINPNSSCSFTELMDQNVEPLRAGGFYKIDCVTLEGTPAGIESQADIDSVIAPICQLIGAEAETTDAFIIGCFADPGLYSAREVTRKPVLGLCEAGLATALNLGERFGVISTSSQSRNAELRQIRSYGLLDRCVGLEPVDIPVVDIATAPETAERALAAAARLKSAGAEVLVLGCAGLAPQRKLLREQIGLPVIDPTLSAVAMALGIVAHG